MTGIYKHKENQPVVWFHRQKSKSNQWCLYCGSFLGEELKIESNKEHLIAREFVPKGSLSDKCFNFIFRACSVCNNKKANIERHISSTTIINSSARSVSQEIDQLALNKAKKDFHPDNPGKTVIESCGEIKVNYGNIMQFGYVFPPQIKNNYIKELALRHIQGIYSLITTKNYEESRLLPPKQLWFFDAFNEQDWGNPEILEVIERTKEWPCFCNIVTANGFFKIIMKRSCDDGWFWALEWNKYLRVIGGISLEDKPQQLFSNLPDLDWKDRGMQGNDKIRKRLEIPLNSIDELFNGTVSNEKNT
ncbi:MAG: hypothetical protein GXO85_16670 [Chlorobi bacterium]|nr:hypothetical protein [Chlorobiota bacterium]